MTLQDVLASSSTLQTNKRQRPKSVCLSIPRKRKAPTCGNPSCSDSQTLSLPLFLSSINIKHHAGQSLQIYLDSSTQWATAGQSLQIYLDSSTQWATAGQSLQRLPRQLHAVGYRRAGMELFQSLLKEMPHHVMWKELECCPDDSMFVSERAAKMLEIIQSAEGGYGARDLHDIIHNETMLTELLDCPLDAKEKNGIISCTLQLLLPPLNGLTQPHSSIAMQHRVLTVRDALVCYSEMQHLTTTACSIEARMQHMDGSTQTCSISIR